MTPVHGLREPCIGGVQMPHGKGQFLGERGRPNVKYIGAVALHSTVICAKKRLNRSRWRLVCGLEDGPKESCVGWKSTGAKVRCHGNQLLAFDGL